MDFELVVSPWDQFKQYVVALGEEPFSEDRQEPVGHAMVTYKPQLTVRFWFPNAASKQVFDYTPTITHEAFHGVWAVFDSRGIVMSEESAEEAGAYYLQWIVCEILTRIKEKP